MSMTAKVRTDIVGLIPAAGKAERIAPLPCSKELYPVAFRKVDEQGGMRCKVVCHFLLESMRAAGVSRALIVLREGKWDIPAYFGNGKMVDMNLAYLMMDLPYGVPYTLDEAYPFVGDSRVVLGFPDILFEPQDAFARLIDRQDETGADVVLGLFPTSEASTMDMVDLGPDGAVRGLHIKSGRTDLRYTWIIGAWGPRFTQFMHQYLAVHAKDADRRGRELFVGDVVREALSTDMRIETVVFEEGRCLDIGTPENMVKAVRREAAGRNFSG